MRLVVGLGGNALARPGEPLDVALQRRRVARAAEALAQVARGCDLVVTHGNGPQVGLLALRAPADPLDVLGAESEGLIGYLLEQQLRSTMPARDVATVLTLVEVDPRDPAFETPTKPIGPARGGVRRLVPSPRPRRVLALPAVRALLDAGHVVVCAGGGGVPVARSADGRIEGVEAVVDKDRATALLAEGLGAERMLLLTDVDAVYEAFGTAAQKPITAARPEDLSALRFDPGSMGPKVEAACDFVRRTGGQAAIGSLDALKDVLAGLSGTQIRIDSR